MYGRQILFVLFSIKIIAWCSGQPNPQYEPTWESLDKRPLPQWYDDAKFGIFIHWGVFSVPSFGSEWFWTDWRSSNATSQYGKFMTKNYKPDFTYQDFAKDFTAEFFDPDEWADLFKKSGAKYVVLTSKHHEGYTLWPSRYSFSWNAKDVGPHRDLVGDLAYSIRNRTDLRFGLYHSLYEWYNPMYTKDRAKNFSTQQFVKYKLLPEMEELITQYKPEVLWSDGDWEARDTYWESTKFLAWLYDESSVRDTIVVNDRWGRDIPCHHGDFFTCTDRYNPGVLQKHKWENAMTIDRKSWGFRRNAKIEDYLTAQHLVKELVMTVSCGGNILMNIGPGKDGTIAPIFQERLLEVGKWLQVNGEAIFKSKPWTYQNDTIGDTWYTQRLDKKTVYALFFQWPVNGEVQLQAANDLFNDKGTVVTLLGYSSEKPLQWYQMNNATRVALPKRQLVNNDWSWVLRITTKT